MLRGDQALLDLKAHLSRAQSKMKQEADKHSWDVQFDVSDLVYLKFCPYRLLSLVHRRNKKLAPKYFGPFCILQCVHPIAYKLDFPPSAQIHPVFHVSQLKKAIGNGVTSYSLTSQLSSNFEWELQPSSVLGIRQHSTTGTGDVLVHWKDLPD